jgi:hypothetical protein
MATGHEQDRDDGGFLSRWSRRKVQVRQGGVVAEPPTSALAPAPATTPAAVAPPMVPAAPGHRVPAARQAPLCVPATAAAGQASAGPTDTKPATEVPPPPTLADVAVLTTESDFARFVAPGVDQGVKNAALKKLFTDPHFNVMDGLDTYIDDYGLADPLPEGMLRQMAQSHALGLFADDPPGAPPTAPTASISLTEPAPPEIPAGLPADVPGLAESTPPAALPLPPIPPKTTPDEDAALRLQPHDAAGPAGPGPGPGPDPGRQP